MNSASNIFNFYMACKHYGSLLTDHFISVGFLLISVFVNYSSLISSVSLEENSFFFFWKGESTVSVLVWSCFVLLRLRPVFNLHCPCVQTVIFVFGSTLCPAFLLCANVQSHSCFVLAICHLYNGGRLFLFLFCVFIYWCPFHSSRKISFYRKRLLKTNKKNKQTKQTDAVKYRFYAICLIDFI